MKQICGLDWQDFLTKRNRGAITCAMNSPLVSLQSHMPFENLFIHWLWTFICEEYLSPLSYVNTTAHALLSCNFRARLQLYEVSDVRSRIIIVCHPISLLFSFETWRQEVELSNSNRFENPLSKTSYFSTELNSKHNICRLNLSWVTKQFINICITIFTNITRSMEDFSHKYQLWKLSRWTRSQIASHAQKVVKCPLGCCEKFVFKRQFHNWLSCEQNRDNQSCLNIFLRRPNTRSFIYSLVMLQYVPLKCCTRLFAA